MKSILEKKYKYVIICYNGIRRKRRATVRAAVKENFGKFKIICIIEKTHTPFNGCRNTKHRRK